VKFRLTIDCDNAAFDPDPAEEVSRILEGLVEVVFVDRDYKHHVMDTNGNTCGTWSLR
jgi:hypothetical protein